ncbi:hypothetical protein [Chlamydia pneumoniae]|uniref:hypothetical protein n=1 Tax=Chlamydia pneumoniae TaxID=83558 RepID=UPI001E2D9527|nr:hypothetical protein [Chlamydia pneumoniae]
MSKPPSSSTQKTAFLNFFQRSSASRASFQHTHSSHHLLTRLYAHSMGSSPSRSPKIYLYNSASDSDTHSLLKLPTLSQTPFLPSHRNSYQTLPPPCESRNASSSNERLSPLQISLTPSLEHSPKVNSLTGLKPGTNPGIQILQSS